MAVHAARPAHVRILYVQDNENNVYMLETRVELTDEFEVLVAEDGEKGRKAAAAQQPVLILMGLEMPVVDGWEATRRLKSNPQTRDMPVIGLSAHALAGERDKAMHRALEREGLAKERSPSRYVLHREQVTGRIVGRVLDKGLSGDEMGERVRLVIDGVDGHW